MTESAKDCCGNFQASDESLSYTALKCRNCGQWLTELPAYVGSRIAQNLERAINKMEKRK